MDRSDIFLVTGTLAGYALGWIHAKCGPISDIIARAWLKHRG